MAINRRVSHAKSIYTRPICLGGLLAFALVILIPRVCAQSPKPGTGGDNIGLKVTNRSKAGLTADAGEFYRVNGRKIRLLRSLEKVAVRHKRNQGPAISKRLKARQRTGSLFAVEQTLAREQMLIMRTSGMASLAELDEAVSQIQQESDVDRITPVYMNEESGLEMICTDEFIVKLTPEATLEQLAILNRNMGITLVRPLRGTTDQFILSMDTFSPGGLLAMCEVYHNDPIIVGASPNFLSQVVFHSSVADFNYSLNQWHLEKIDAAGAWDITTGSRDIVVAVMDDGVDIQHEALRDSFPSSSLDPSDNGYHNDFFGWNFYDNDNDPRPSDVNDNHGTGVAGVIAARMGNSTEDVFGCAYDCTLMAIKLLKGRGENCRASISDCAEAILYAAGFQKDGVSRWRGADVINISIALSSDDRISDALHRAATEGRQGKGCPIFCSTGNSANDGWEPTVVPIQAGTHTFKWEYRKDIDITRGDDTVWLDSVVFPGGEREAFDSSELPSGWTTGSNSESLAEDKWYAVREGVESGYRYYEVNHAMTGIEGHNSYSVRPRIIDDNEYSYIQVTKTVEAGSLVFYCWASCQSDYDGLRFYVDGEPHSDGDLIATGITNATTNVHFPASHPDTIAVGASTEFGYRADYSCYGLGLDFVAPGGGGGGRGIYTTDRSGSLGKNDTGNYYSRFGGTSASSPIAAGVAALMLSNNPNLTSHQVRRIMNSSCDQIDLAPYANGRIAFYGHGQINAKKAVEASSDPVGMVFVSINDNGSNIWTWLESHGGFNGEMSKYEVTNAQYCQYLNAALAEGLIQVKTNEYVGTVWDGVEKHYVYRDIVYSVYKGPGTPTVRHLVCADVSGDPIQESFFVTVHSFS